MVREEALKQLICPQCGGPLESRLPEALDCHACGQAFPVVLGIPDFRIRTMGTEENEMLQALLERYGHLSFAGLIDYYATNFSPAHLTKDVRVNIQEYFKATLERSWQELELLRRNIQKAGIMYASRRCLDLGCGIGTGAAAASAEFDEVFGIDTSMWRLIVARKFFEGQGISNVVLICGYAESLPFPDHFFDLVWAINVIEHLDDCPRALAEVVRTLRQAGCFTADSGNRFNLFTPEPHVLLRWVGLWPRCLASWYVMQRKGMPYLGTRLLSYMELKRLLREHFGPRNYWIYVRLPEGKRLRWLNPLLRFPLIATLLKWIAPMYDVAAVRPERVKNKIY